MAEQVAAQRLGRREAGLQRDERLDDLAGHRVGLADHAGLGDRRVLHQRALDLERPDQMAGGFDHVVGAADEPVVAFRVAHREIAGQVPGAGEAFAVALVLVQVAAHHRRPAGLQRQFALGHRLLRSGSTRAVRGALHDRRLDPRQRPAHRARLHVHRREIGDHDAARFGLPPVVVERPAEGLLTPDHRLRVQRLADAGEEAQGGEVVAAHRLGAELHHHADRGRRGVPDADPLAVAGCRTRWRRRTRPRRRTLVTPLVSGAMMP